MNSKHCERIDLLDLARFAAALIVLVFHYFFNGIANGKIASLRHVPDLAEVARYGYLGVDFFFILSGYVILRSARGKTAGTFALSRALRLYPAFWASVLVTGAFATAWGGPHMSVTTSQILANLTMAAPVFGYDWVDGVYWTLAYEARFYVVVWMLLLLPNARLALWATSWAIAQLAASILGIQDYPLLGGYYVFFAAGCLLAVADGRPLRWLVLALHAFLCIHVASEDAYEKTATTGVAFSPVVASLFVTGCLAFLAMLNIQRVATVRIPGALILGGLSYPIYLVHAHIGYMLLSRFGDDQHKAMSYIVVIGAVLGIAVIIHLGIERALAGLWRALFCAFGAFGNRQ